MKPRPLSLEELAARVGTSTPRRQFLFERLRTVVQLLHGTGQVKRVYIFGSFVAATPLPNDVDRFVIMAREFTTAALDERSATVFTHELCQIRYNIDIFWVTEAVGGAAIKTCSMFSRAIVPNNHRGSWR